MAVASTFSPSSSNLVNETARAERQAVSSRANASSASAGRGEASSFVQMLSDQQAGVTSRPTDLPPAGKGGAPRDGAAGPRSVGDRLQMERAYAQQAERQRMLNAAANAERAESPRAQPDRNPAAKDRPAAGAVPEVPLEATRGESGEHSEAAVAQSGGGQTLAQWLQQIGVVAAGPGVAADAGGQGPDAQDSALPAGSPAWEKGVNRATGGIGGIGGIGASGPGGAQRTSGRQGTGLSAARAGFGSAAEGTGQGPESGRRVEEPAERMVAADASLADGVRTGAESPAADETLQDTALSGTGEGGSAREAAISLAGFGGFLGAAVTGGAAATGSTEVSAAPATSEVAVATPADAPGAGDEVMLHVSRFASEGVREARLHLNPVEMGPIEVRIALEGEQARIDFAAAHEATREMLQAHVPALARALEADGLKWAGSEVSAPPSPGSEAPADGWLARGEGTAAGRDGAAGEDPGGGRDREHAAAGRPTVESGRHSARGQSLGEFTGGGASPGDGGASTLRALDLYA
jgi:flagellar hook-length control protein FliK